ncbi:MAG: 4-hydroxy-tetrahydrodipicolinate reductase [Saprospiraceae bacterium]|nr:4-hydroxy-tetrahydrodipicolinate reductase [Saprospiraceae bacterium]
MKICLIGYGKMGKAIEKIALDLGHEISGRINQQARDQLNTALSHSDVAIEFSRPESAVEHLKACIAQQIPVVCGTTGWLEHWTQINALVKEKSGALVYSSNFSVGVQLFFNLNKKLAALMASHPEYRCKMKEIHHIHKLDAPSGTAISLANDILHINPRLEDWKLEPAIQSEVIPIESVRESEVIGTHFIRYTSSIDEIEIKHEAFSRDGFAKGAVLAAEWILHKKGVFSMQDVLGLNEQ